MHSLCRPTSTAWLNDDHRHVRIAATCIVTDPIIERISG